MSAIPALILFCIFMIGVPVGFSLLIATGIYYLFINNTMPVDMMFQALVTSTESYPLLAIPFFVTAGVVMNYSGISSRLMSAAEAFVGHMVGGLAQVNVLLSVLMGGISGSCNADAAMQCKILVPEMSKRGYGKAFSAVVTAASSCITPIIPPGIVLILYSCLTNVSVGRMFMAGYIPGIMMAIALMILVSFISKKRGYKATREKRASFREIIKQLMESSWALFLPFGIILGLRFGWFTPTEAGAMTVLYSIFVGAFIYKELKFSHVKQILKESVSGTSSILFIIAAANCFGRYMNIERIPQTVTESLMGFTSSPIVLLLIINLLLFFVGMFIEGGAAMIILAPLKLGIDPVHLGIIMSINLTLGGLTPPFGTMLFLTSSILDIKVKDFIRESLPFIAVLVGVLMILVFIPQLVTFLPNLVYGA